MDPETSTVGFKLQGDALAMGGMGPSRNKGKKPGPHWLPGREVMISHVRKHKGRAGSRHRTIWGRAVLLRDSSPSFSVGFPHGHKKAAWLCRDGREHRTHKAASGRVSLA